MSLPFYVVNSFAQGAFSGNPAGVIVLEKLDCDQFYLKKVVRTTGLPEISFITAGSSEGCYHIRWITLEAEEDLCGHGSIAAAHIIRTALEHEGNIVLHKLGREGHRLRVDFKDDWYRMLFPTLHVEGCDGVSVLEAALHSPIAALYRGRSYLAMLAEEGQLAELVPDRDEIASLDLPGVIVAAPGDETDFVCRYFAPQKGIDEDMATGTAHISVAQLYFRQRGKRRFVSRQLSRSGGSFMIDVIDQEQCWLSGQAFTLCSGRIEL